MKQVRGIRNNNPGNIRWGDPWQGLVSPDQRTDKDFCQFINPSYGIRALARTLITYQDKYKLYTIRQMIGRWAPPNENNTPAYVSAVATQTGRGPDTPLNVQSYPDLRAMVEAIIRHENGKGPVNSDNTWYDGLTIDKGLQLAGVEPDKTKAGPVPVTKETIGATATAGVGVSQIAEAAPAVMDAITNAQDSLTSGQVSRIIVGVVLVGLAAFIAWGQVMKHKSGVI